MTTPTRPVVILACRILRDPLEPLLPPEVRARTTFLDSGLHRSPRDLRARLQEALHTIPEPSLVLVGYGLCGNGLDGLRAGPHTLVLPKVDDCIAILLGSREAYREEFRREPGTYWLTKGWLETKCDPLGEYERYVPLYGEGEAMWVMDQQFRHYRRLVLLALGHRDLEAYRGRAREVARFCERWGMRYEERLGSDRIVRKLAAVARGEEEPGPDFIVARPGEEIRQAQFLG